MALEVQIPGAGSTAKIRSPFAPALLPFVTLFIYLFCWWYFINREMKDFGKAKGSKLGDSPTKSVLALTFGALIIVPAVWTTVTTFKRVQAAQKLAGIEPLNGWIGLILYLVISPAFYAYMQSGLNNLWRTVAQEPVQEPAAQQA